MAALDERWKNGHAECWQHKVQTAAESLGQGSDDDDDDDE